MLTRDCEIFGNLASENLRFNLYCCSYLLVWSGRASCALQTALSCSTPGTWHHCPRVLCHHGQCSTEALSNTDAHSFNAEHLVIWISKIHVKMFDSCTELPINKFFKDWNTKPLLRSLLAPLCVRVTVSYHHRTLTCLSQHGAMTPSLCQAACRHGD